MMLGHNLTGFQSLSGLLAGMGMGVGQQQGAQPAVAAGDPTEEARTGSRPQAFVAVSQQGSPHHGDHLPDVIGKGAADCQGQQLSREGGPMCLYGPCPAP